MIISALEHDAIILSEDGGLRTLASSMGVNSTIWVQPLLTILRDKNYLDYKKYVEIIFNKIKMRHNFTSITANDLLFKAKSSPNSVCPEVESIIMTFKDTNLDLDSGIRVGTDFLFLVAKFINVNTLYKYYKLLLDSLSFEREKYIPLITESVNLIVTYAMHQLEPKKAKAIKRKFGSKLELSKQSRNKIKPLVLAIRKALYEY